MVFTAEIYPTAIRNMGLGTSNAIGRLGASLAPFMVNLGDSHGLTLFVFGALTLVGGFLVFLLPETLNKNLTKTIDEGEIFNKGKGSKKAWFSCKLELSLHSKVSPLLKVIFSIQKTLELLYCAL